MLGRLLVAARPLSRAFATRGQALATLKTCLTTESEHEKTEYARDTYLEDFIKKTGFKVEENPEKVEVLLKKSIGNTEVVVSFLARPPEDPGPEGEEPADQQADDDDNKSWVDFQASISTGAKGLIFECSSAKNEMTVNNIVVTRDVNSTERVSNFLNAQKQYRGPDFDGLDEELQKAFMHYLSVHGVDEDLATFIESYSLDKEQRLYMDWLAKVNSTLV